MPVPPSELSILASTATPQAVRALADENAMAYPTAYATVRDLEERGLVFSFKEGKSRVVRPSDPALPGLARALLFETPREDLAGIFHGDRVLQFHALDRVKKPGLAAAVVGKTRRAIEQTIHDFAPRGFLVKTSHGFELHPRHRNYRAFFDQVARVEAWARIRDFAPGAVLIWYVGPEALFKTADAVDADGAVPAGFDRFAEFGVELEGDDFRTYHVARRALGPADAMMEAILAAGDTPIHRSYCSLLYEKTRPSDVEETARIYGLETVAQGIVQYVEKKKGLPGFLAWREHERYRREYGLGA